VKRFRVKYWIQVEETVRAYDADHAYTMIRGDAEDVKVEYLGDDEPEWEQDDGESKSNWGDPY